MDLRFWIKETITGLGLLNKRMIRKSLIYSPNSVGRGFTLVELMIVIGVIGVLALIVTSVLNPVEIMKKARDAQRLSDLQSIKKSIDLAISDGGSFDTSRCSVTTPCDSLSGTRVVNGTGYINIDVSKYLNILPVDPLNSQSTFVDGKGATVSSSYQFATNGTDYEIRAHLESKINTSATEGEDRYNTDGGCRADWFEVGTNLCLLN